jgi:hypothetical protein
MDRGKLGGIGTAVRSSRLRLLGPLGTAAPSRNKAARRAPAGGEPVGQHLDDANGIKPEMSYSQVGSAVARATLGAAETALAHCSVGGRGEDRRPGMSGAEGAHLPEGQRLERPAGPKPHRCNPELEKIIDALFIFPPTLGPPWRAFIRCMRSDPSPPAVKASDRSEA